MRTVTAFIRLSRPHFLLGGLVMYALGAAAITGPISVRRYLIGQLMVTAAQITAHYVNEHADYEADLAIANRTAFSGGSGVLTSGSLPRNTALRAGQVSTVVAVGTAAWVATFSPVAAIVGLAALAVSWAYSVPPVRLLNTGFGELATALTVAGLVPLAGVLAQQPHVPPSLWWTMGVLVALQLAMLLAFEIPDLEADATSGKTVLGVRLGRRRTMMLMGVLVLLAALLVAFGVQHRVAIGGLASVPLVLAGVITLRSSRYGLATFCAVAAFFLCGAGFVIAEVASR